MANECEKCDHFAPNHKAVECSSCVAQYYDGIQLGSPSNFKPRPQTNADRIRAMNDEELAKFLPSICRYARKTQSEHNMCVKAECEKCLSRWLKQPAEGE